MKLQSEESVDETESNRTYLLRFSHDCALPFQRNGNNDPDRTSKTLHIFKPNIHITASPTASKTSIHSFHSPSHSSYSSYVQPATNKAATQPQ